MSLFLLANRAALNLGRVKNSASLINAMLTGQTAGGDSPVSLLGHNTLHNSTDTQGNQGAVQRSSRSRHERDEARRAI